MRHPRTGQTGMDGDDVEAVAIPWPTVAGHPYRGSPGYGLSLLPPHRLDPGSELIRTPGLHLDEGDQRSFADDQVDVVSSGAEPVCLDAPSERDEIRKDVLLAAHTENVTGIGPFIDRDAFGSAGHDNKVGRTGLRSVIRFIRTSDEKMLLTLVVLGIASWLASILPNADDADAVLSVVEGWHADVRR